MRKASLSLLVPAALLAVLLLAQSLSAQNGDGQAATRKVFDFLKSCGVYFLATDEGGQPRVRPFGSLAIFEGRIYFQTGKVKDVSRQLLVNPKIEICAFDGKEAWIRVEAVAVEDDRLEAKQFLLDAHPELKAMYSADDGNTQVFYLRDAKARMQSFSKEGWTETF
ncbi:MAG: pyridoxamine 5'-phosphate oxidase family protein [Deltaproteobacteria bacterium]|jgi:uncharacterized pyridoxamine 5'-phosphate oxidase family protein|nr:pyridoxamine 5'-phosphate oxidase family protein [Deltaproteobacteria bacterium]